jgi:anti-sigma factor RsiW
MTMACDRIDHVHRYHDGELAPADREVMEAHIRQCAECRRALAELRALSSLLVSAPLAEMPQGVAVRYDRCRRAARERGVLRMAGWLTAAAAVVLIGALLTRFAGTAEVAGLPGVWQTVMVTPSADLHESDGSDVVVAEWMADDLSAGEQW